MPPVSIASLRLQFSQAFNGVASFTGPLIASKYFFADPDSTDLTNVQWVYLAVSGMGVIVAVAFFFTKLPEVSESELEHLLVHGPPHEQKSIWKETRCLTGAVAQFMYGESGPGSALPSRERTQSLTGSRRSGLHRRILPVLHPRRVGD
jgi:FHS family L-fucose permease-like MFS transporter